MVTRARDAGVLGREIEHTADLGFEVEAPTLAEVFERAGLMLVGVMIDLGGVEAREQVDVAVEAATTDELLHDWLQALLVRYQGEGFAACELAVQAITPTGVRGVASGERVDPARHRLGSEVKGVTYHQLAVRQTDAGWWARVIVDV